MDKPTIPTLSTEKKKHKWATGGVSGYPLSHPIVGQSRFYQTFKQFIHVTDQEAEKFAHVFAIVAQWGIGKSRLGYELISQINDTSKGWFVRDVATDKLNNANLFYDDPDREKYLGLYIRYSQIANEQQDIDNWFSYGLYKSLLALALKHFDGSIQGQIAEEAYNRLLVKGFDETELAKALEVGKEGKNYPDKELLDDHRLLNGLCNAAYDYLKGFGIEYILIVLDELETVAEAATYGLDADKIKGLDGRAIKLMGKAIKEEDPRRRLPWLRYVALCSPAIGDELREIKSTARRFEIEDLAQNSFSDVSDLVKALREDNRLTENYPTGLVEAAYAMSGGNFGWFNVIMANVDEVLHSLQLQRESERRTQKRPSLPDIVPTIGDIFDKAAQSTSRIRDYVLDHQAVDEIKISDPDYRKTARELLYGQLPLSLTNWSPAIREALLDARNEYDEPIATLYRRVEWDEQACSSALRGAKFKRDKNEWLLPGIDQPLELNQLLANLSTYAIHEAKDTPVIAGKRILLVPIEQKEFTQLVSLLYPHPAGDDAARALWSAFIGEDRIPMDKATHMGPSIAMLGRLDLRYHRKSHNSLIFRDPDQSAAYESLMEKREKQDLNEKAEEVLTGAMRLIDNYWDYDAVSAGLKRGAPPAIVTLANRRGAEGGLVSCEALKLHPEGRLILAYVRNEPDLSRMCDEVAYQFSTKGRTPVIAFTPSRNLVDVFEKEVSGILKDAREYLLLYQLTPGEEFILHQIGVPQKDQKQFKLENAAFSTAFSQRLHSLERGLTDKIHSWRHLLNNQGRIAWPFKPGSSLRDDERKELFNGWIKLLISTRSNSATSLDEKAELDIEKFQVTLKKMAVPLRARSAGYDETERAMLFKSLDNFAEADFPPFLQSIITRLLKKKAWTLEDARIEWFWGYLWDGSKEKDVFTDWMTLACELGFAVGRKSDKAKAETEYELRGRQELSNTITEAKNWLEKDYPKIVEEMEQVFGYEKVNAYFGSQGTKTKTAKQKIDEANGEYQQLTREDSVSRLTKEESKQIFIESVRLRLSILDKAYWVYSKDKSESIDGRNISTLNFEDDNTALWERIKRAEAFTKLVRNTERKIKERISVLVDELEKQISNLPGFPKNVFTRSFVKIENILAGALEPTDPTSATQRKQQTEYGTLGQYLKDLKAGEAKNKLAQLAKEVGIDIENNMREIPFAEINGSIIQGFFKLKSAYEQTFTQLTNYKERLNRLESVLQNVPSDFNYPKDTPSIDELILKIEFITENLDSINADEVERLISENDSGTQVGNFQRMMQDAQRLLEEPKRALAILGGQIQTVENVVADYRKRLLNDQDIRNIEIGLNALLQAQGKPQRPPLTIADLEKTGSLEASVKVREERRRKWKQEAEETLDGTGVSFEQWQQIVADLEAGRSPKLDAAKDEKLVTRGFLVRTYRLGGQK